MSQTDNLVRMLAVEHVGVEERKSDGKPAGSVAFGHFARFGEWTEINSWFEGNFMERLAPGAFAATIGERGDRVRFLYDHGHDPSIGNKPLGVLTALREDARGAYYEADLFDVDYVNDLKPAMRAKQLGSSFRFSVREESWVEKPEAGKHNPKGLPERTITAVDLYELGPVTFPAYATATAGLRSRTDEFLTDLLRDDRFLARFIERVGANVAAPVVTSAAAAGPVSHPDATVGPEGHVARGRLVATARTQLLNLKGA